MNLGNDQENPEVNIVLVYQQEIHLFSLITPLYNQITLQQKNITVLLMPWPITTINSKHFHYIYYFLCSSFLRLLRGFPCDIENINFPNRKLTSNYKVRHETTIQITR